MFPIGDHVISHARSASKHRLFPGVLAPLGQRFSPGLYDIHGVIKGGCARYLRSYTECIGNVCQVQHVVNVEPA